MQTSLTPPDLWTTACSDFSELERAGSTIGHGTYTIEHAIGRGGMGTVFAGIHNWTGRKVAIKVLRREVTDGADAARILQEARAATSIAHPNVVEVLDMGRDTDGSVYLVFERLIGRTLAERIERGGALGVEEVSMLLLPILDALAVAHERGIIHRDIKPENIFLENTADDGVRAKLLDFGLAKMERSSARQTNSGTVVGTPAYMSPERAHGRRDVGPATDVWSMGVVLHECLRGRPLFEADHPMAVLLAIVNDPVPTLVGHPGVPDAIADVVASALLRDLDARLPDARALRDAWAKAAGVAIGAGRASGLPPRWRWEQPGPPASPRRPFGPPNALRVTSGSDVVPRWLSEAPWPRRHGAAMLALVTGLALVAFGVVALGATRGGLRSSTRVVGTDPAIPAAHPTPEPGATFFAPDERAAVAASTFPDASVVAPGHDAPRAEPATTVPRRASTRRHRGRPRTPGVMIGRNGAPIFD